MAMKAHMTAKDYLGTLSQEQLEAVCSLKTNPQFAQFLIEPNMGPIESARYASDCTAVGIPIEYTNTPAALHYLTIAITNYLKGNA